jgi:hypothetical protein
MDEIETEGKGTLARAWSAQDLLRRQAMQKLESRR